MIQVTNNPINFDDLIKDYLNSTDDQKSDYIYSTFLISFQQQPCAFQEKIVSQIYYYISKIKGYNNANYLFNSLNFAYRFIFDYEFLIDLTCIGPQRHKSRNNLIYLNDKEINSLIKINVQCGDQNHPFCVSPDTFISSIALAIGVFYHVEYENVFLYYKNQSIDRNFLVRDYNINQNDTINAIIQNNNLYQYSYSESFLSLRINNDDELFHYILRIIKEENFLSFCSPDQAKQITKVAWRLLKVIPSYQPLLRDLIDTKYAIETFNREKTELGRRYILQIMKKIYSNDRKKREIIDFAFELITRELTDNELRDTFEIISFYYESPKKINFDKKLILMICKIIINTNNPRVCQSALNLLTEMKLNSEIEKFILTLENILHDIMKKEICDVIPFFNSFRMHTELFNILKTLVNEFSNNEFMLKRLFQVLKNLINLNCDTEDTFKLVLETMKTAKPDILVEYLEFLWHSLEVKPQLLYETTQKKTIDFHSIIEYLFNFISNLNTTNEEQQRFKHYEKQLRTVSLKIFIILCKNNDSIKKLILKKMEVMSKVSCIRFNYSPEAFKRNSNGYCGLRNLGSTCYMNSVFQQLYFNTDFRTEILNQKDENNEFVREIRHLFINLAFSNQASVDTNNFAIIWGENDPHFSVRNQEDAREFFQKVLSKLPNDVNRTFSGKQTTRIEGINVKFNREVVQDFNLIEIQVKGFSSFEQSLPTIFNPQMFTGSNQYHDEKLGNIDVRLTLEYTLPKTVVFLLKRFDFNKDTSNRVKITNQFTFPLNFNADKYFPGQTGEYYLKGVIAHTGTADGGHYTSLIKEGNVWINFDDMDSRNISDYEFNENVIGNQNVENAKCAYLLFYENRSIANDPNKNYDIRSYLSQQEIDQITKENNDFSITQAAFDSSTADFALNSNDLLFTIHYFINVLCHSNLINLSNSFADKILKYINENKLNAIMINSYLNESQDLIFEITGGAAAEFKDSILKILNQLFEKVDAMASFPIVNFIVKNLKESISVWRTLPYLAKIICSYLKVDEEHVKIGSQNSWGNQILSYIQTFYDGNLGHYAVNNVDFSNLFESLEIFFNSMDPNQMKSFVTKYENVIEKSNSNIKYFRSLKDMIYGVKQAQSATKSPEDFCKHIVNLDDKDLINQSIEKCGKSKIWILESLAKYSSLVAPTLLKFQSEVLLPLLTDEDFHNREKAEKLMYKIFNDLPPLENYQKAELLYFGRSYINVFDRYMAEESNKKNIYKEISAIKKKQKYNKRISTTLIKEIKKKYKMKDSHTYYINKEADNFINSALEFIGVNHTKLLNRMSHIFRIIHWLKVRLRNTNITNLREVLNFVGTQETTLNIDLIELFHLYQTFTEDQFDSFFKENNFIIMFSFCPGYENLLDRVARFVMFISLISTAEQFIMCLKSDKYFFPAYSYLIECPLPQPSCYMAAKICFILSRSFIKKSDEENDENDENEDYDDGIDNKQLSNPVKITDDYCYEEDENDENDENLNPEINDDKIDEINNNENENDDDDYDYDDDKENKIENLLNDYQQSDYNNKDEDNGAELSEEGKTLILCFIEFIGIHADYSFFTPQNTDNESCFIRILDKVKSYFTPDLTSLYINQYFNVYDFLSSHSNLNDFTNLIFSLPHSDEYKVTQEMANKIVSSNFKRIFVENEKFHGILINLVSSSSEFSLSFISEFELLFKNEKKIIENKKIWRIADIYLYCSKSNGQLKGQIIIFFVSHFFDSGENLKACIQFAKSENGKKCLKMINLIIKQNDPNISQDDIFNATIELFGFLTGNKIPISQEVEEFLIIYLENLEIEDLDVENLAEEINNKSPNFEYSVKLLDVFFKAKVGMKEFFLQNYPINQDVLNKWPENLKMYRSLFIM